MTEPPDLARIREANRGHGLARRDLPARPIELWRRWLADARSAGLSEANAMIVSTVDPDGTPSSRTVLCKGADDDGFVFFTNYLSRKGMALADEPVRVGGLLRDPSARRATVGGGQRAVAGPGQP